MARSEKEGTVIIFDVGKNSLNPATSLEDTYFNRSKLCIQKILQRKIFSKPKDEIGLLLMGTRMTSNHLNRTIGGYDYITEAFEMAITNWQMLRVIENEIKQDDKIADWMDALIVSMDFLRRASETRKYTSLKIVLLTTFSTFVNNESVEVVIKGLKNMNIELIVIGEHLINKEIENNAEEDDNMLMVFSQNRNISQEQKNSETLIERVVEETGGILCGFQDVLAKLLYFPKKKVKGTPWNAYLTIGSNIKMAISAYIYITEDKSIPSFKTESSHENTYAKFTKEYFKNDERMEIDATELIKAYMYGDAVVPIDYDIKEDTDTVTSLMCIGFSRETDVSSQIFMGTGTYLVIAQKSCSISNDMLSAFVFAMLKTNTIMITRRVYRKGSPPKLYALLPKLHQNQYPCFSMIELPMKNNLTDWTFANLSNSKNIEPTEEQYNIVDKLIDSMDLMKVHNEESGCPEALAFKKRMNPANQYIYRCISQRALNPSSSLEPPDQELLDMLDIPQKLKDRAKPHLEKIKEIYKLEPVAKSISKHKAQIALQNKNTNGDDTSLISVNDDIDTRNIAEIGTVSPMEDFVYLLERGERISVLFKQIENIISDLLFKSIVYQKDKILETIKMYRRETAIMGAHYYNIWIIEFKKLVLSKGKKDFWDSVIVAERLGLQTAEENDSTTVTVQEAEEFYKDIVTPADIAQAELGDVDVDDLFDNM